MLAGWKWLWGLLKQVGEFVRGILNVATSWLFSLTGWLVGGLIFILYWILDWVGNGFHEFMRATLGVAIPDLPSYPLANWIAIDLLALDWAWSCLLIYVAARFVSCLSRLSFTVIKAFLEIV